MSRKIKKKEIDSSRRTIFFNLITLGSICSCLLIGLADRLLTSPSIASAADLPRDQIDNTLSSSLRLPPLIMVLTGFLLVHPDE